MAPHSLSDWVAEVSRLTEPSRVVWWEDTSEEHSALTREMVQSGELIRLDPRTHPNCFLHRSPPGDVTRVEDRTFICTETQAGAGPLNHWMAPDLAKGMLRPLLAGCMRGRTMYVVPYLLGPAQSPYRQVGVQVTDSRYVVASLRVMTRTGRVASEDLGTSRDFVRGLHALCGPEPERRFLCHFPQEKLIWSTGSGYGGNALLPKKSHALRLASCAGFKEGWLAEHMLILGLESPAGDVTYVAAAFPSGAGKTNLAMLVPPRDFEGWKVRTVGDDIAWIRPGPDGRLYAMNPEAGIFGTAPGTNERTNPVLLNAVRRNTIYSNVALSEDDTPWWEGMGGLPGRLSDWQGRPWTPERGTPAAHPNARFAVPLAELSTFRDRSENPAGVPLDAIIFGGKRRDLVPLVFETFGWDHGVFVGATLRSETTHATSGETGQLRWDPMAMLAFCGYDMAEYFNHWLKLGRNRPKAPKIYHVNWFRTDAEGRLLWPGFSENIRVLQWIRSRCRGEISARRTPLGYIPSSSSFNLPSRDTCAASFDQLFCCDVPAWEKEIQEQRAFLETFGSLLPKALWDQHRRLFFRMNLDPV